MHEITPLIYYFCYFK